MMMIVGLIVCLFLVHSWEGSGMDETGQDRLSGKVRVRVDKKYLRPTEVVSSLCCNSR